MDYKKATDDIRSVLLEAGEHALNIQKTIKRQYKQGQQAVTQADLDISKMVAQRLSHWLEREDQVLIDEESIDTIATPGEVFAATRYQWVLDPIDGTAGYALGRDKWGISLGLLENGRPAAGGFYMPALGALIVVEEGKAFYTDIHTNQKRQVPDAQPMEVNSQIFIESFFGFEDHWGENTFQNKAWLNTPESALQAGYSTLMQQSAGMTVFGIFSLWDIAGIAVIAKAAGFEFTSLQDGKKLETFTGEHFDPSWKLKGRWVVSHPKTYQAIRDALTGNTGDKAA
ncbi:MAG: inositol monophosphatase family protein [Alphaproteobacteria bacterium]